MSDQPRAERTSMHGFLNINKPAGMTSHDVVAQLRRVTRQKRVGHAGTLDPAATGVLVLAIGKATRLIEYVQDQTNKRYVAAIQLGTTTTTDDAEGEVLVEQPVPSLSTEEIQSVLAPFVGQIQQVPPMYSALHHEGQRLYDLARAGVSLDLPARPVQIDSITLLAWVSPLITIDVICGKGTYIRSLARDIGTAIGCGAHLRALQRTAVGTFTIEQSLPLDALDSPEAAAQALLPPETAVADWPRIDLNEKQVRLLRNGLTLSFSNLAGDHARAHGPDGTLLGLLRREEDHWQPEKVFDWQ